MCGKTDEMSSCRGDMRRRMSTCDGREIMFEEEKEMIVSDEMSSRCGGE